MADIEVVEWRDYEGEFHSWADNAPDDYLDIEAMRIHNVESGEWKTIGGPIPEEGYGLSIDDYDNFWDYAEAYVAAWYEAEYGET